MTNDLLSPKEAAAYLTVSRSTVYELVKARQLTIVKIRSASRIRRSELDRYLRDAERTTAA